MMPHGDPERAAASCSVRLTVELVIRPCHRRDLEPLEWFGAYTAHRAFVAAQFARHLRGENVMLVATHRDFPVGQVWIDLVKRSAERTATLWALRVLEPFQGLGVGRTLLAAAEARAADAGCVAVEIGVEKHLRFVRGFYERLGFTPIGEEVSEEVYAAPDGPVSRYVFDQWVLRKPLYVNGPR